MLASPSSATSAASRYLVSSSFKVTLSKALAAQVSSCAAPTSSSSPSSHHHLLLRQHVAANTTATASFARRNYTTSAPPPPKTTTVFSMTPQCRHSTTALQQQQQQQRAQRGRPTVNGESIPFHVSDLIDAPCNLNTSIRPHQNGHHNKKKTKPFTRRTYESDLVVILDMDECIIHSQFLSSPAAAQVYAHQLKAQQRHHHNSSKSSNNNHKKPPVDSFRFALPDGDLVHVNVRPGLADFLKAVTDKFETHVFTAAVDVYAKPLLDRLDPDGTMFAGRWYREHCAWDGQQGAHVKDLSRLPIVYEKNPERCVLVDNNPLSFLANPSNGILVSSFYNDSADDSLPAVWDLLQELDDVTDVRPVLEERFGLSQALQDVQHQQQASSKPSL